MSFSGFPKATVQFLVQAEPRVNGSIMRINRDVRFSKDKSPYKDHLDLWFWSMLARCRDAVLDDARGEALAKTVAQLRKAGVEVGGEHYKKPPKGVPADHPRAQLPKHDGLHAGHESPHPKELHGPGFVDHVLARFAAVAPLHAWLSGI